VHSTAKYSAARCFEVQSTSKAEQRTHCWQRQERVCGLIPACMCRQQQLCCRKRVSPAVFEDLLVAGQLWQHSHGTFPVASQDAALELTGVLGLHLNALQVARQCGRGETHGARDPNQAVT
jgi:hypothetical protein